jgi:molybdate transport system permease protein
VAEDRSREDGARALRLRNQHPDDDDEVTPEDAAIVRLSLWVAFCATVASLPLAVAVAALLSRAQFWGKSLVNGLVHLPLVLPPVVTGYVLLRLFGRQGPIGHVLEQWFGIVFAFRWTGAALAAAVMGFPLMVSAIRVALDGVDHRLEESARTLGANRIWAFLTISLPLVVPGLVSGMVLAFAKSLGEFGATITFVSNIPGETQTLALAIYTLTQSPGGDARAVRLVLLSVALSFAALVASELLARRARRAEPR